MNDSLLTRAASIADLKRIARSRLPAFAYDYIRGGCNDDYAVKTNRHHLDQIYLNSNNLKTAQPIQLNTSIFNQQYSAPFGIAPLGLSGIAWPRASEMHARAAHKQNIPFILSSVSTTSIENAARHAKENFWFQLYPPKDIEMRVDMMKRAAAAGCKNLVVTIDVPSLSWRPHDIKNGLAIPPRISLKSIVQTVLHPRWALAMAKTGMPEFETLKPYIDDKQNLQQKARNIRHALREVVDADVLKFIRDNWQGKLIVKGILNIEDAGLAIECGADGIIVSNHGGRQLDAALSPIQVLSDIANKYKSRATIMADSGVESGVDIARFLASGAQMVFCGRAFMYGVAAFDKKGASHTVNILNAELTQLLEQVRCPHVNELSKHLVYASH